MRLVPSWACRSQHRYWLRPAVSWCVAPHSYLYYNHTGTHVRHPLIVLTISWMTQLLYRCTTTCSVTMSWWTSRRRPVGCRRRTSWWSLVLTRCSVAMGTRCYWCESVIGLVTDNQFCRWPRDTAQHEWLLWAIATEYVWFLHVIYSTPLPTRKRVYPQFSATTSRRSIEPRSMVTVR